VTVKAVELLARLFALVACTALGGGGMLVFLMAYDSGAPTAAVAIGGVLMADALVGMLRLCTDAVLRIRRGQAATRGEDAES
jgi:hypothetical protein